MLFSLILKTILRKEVTVMAVIYATLIIKGTQRDIRSWRKLLRI